MASKQKHQSSGATTKELSEFLDDTAKRIDRAKVLFEQYFMGIQKTAPMQLRGDLERRIRDMTKQHIPNSRLRYKFTMLSQRFASYNTYWKRTMRQIENGTYIKHVAKVGRDAIRNGKDVPDEILAKMPKRMRERILKDREMALKIDARKKGDVKAQKQAGKVLSNTRKNVHTLDEADLDNVDFDSLFSQMVGGEDLMAANVKVAATTVSAKTNKAKPPLAPTHVADAKAAAAPRQGAKSPPRRTPPPRPGAPSKTPPKPVPLPPGMNEREAKKLYQRYIKARKLVGEKTEGVTYGKLMRSLSKQSPKVLEKHASKGVSWNVEVKGEKVILKAKPKKEG